MSLALSGTLVDVLADALGGGARAAAVPPPAFTSLADPLHERVLVVDTAARLTYANDAARRDFSVMPGRPAGEPALPSSPGADADAPDHAWSVRTAGASSLVVHAAAGPGNDVETLRAALERERARSAAFEILAVASRAFAAAGTDGDACCALAADVATTLACAEGALVSRTDDADARTSRGVRGAGTLAAAADATLVVDFAAAEPSRRLLRVRIANEPSQPPAVDAAFAATWAARQAMVAPLIVGDRVVGAITVINSMRGAFNARDGELLRMLADHAALAVHRPAPGRGGPRAPGAAAAITDAMRRQRHQRSVGELLPGVVHDLNNPLTGVSAFAELLQEEPSLDESAREAVAMIRKEALRAIRIIKDVLHFARPVAHAVPSGVDVNAIIEATLRLRGYLIRGASIQVSTQLESELPRVRGDAQQLQAALMHLLANAEDALAAVPAGERELRVSTIRRGNDVVISVADSGAGMSPETQRRMFEPFFTTRPADAGAGLGLSIASGIVEAHGGAIAVRSDPGAGTRLEICFPSTVTVPVATPEPVS